MYQKVLKLVAYLHKYTTELHQTYTEYFTIIYWFVNVEWRIMLGGTWRHRLMTSCNHDPE